MSFRDRCKPPWRCPAVFRLALLACALSAPGFAAAEALLRGLGPEPDSLDIHQAQGVSALNVLRDVREGLLKPGPDGAPVAGMSHAWEVSADGRRYVFQIRPDACWSNGDRVTAADFVRGFGRLLNAASLSPNAGLLDAVRDGKGRPQVLALSDTLLEIRLRYPVAWFPFLLTHPLSYPLHEDHVETPRLGPFNGAYRLETWIPKAELRLVKNPCYWDAAGARVATVRYFPIEDPASELSRYRAGELHITETIPPGRFAWLRENLPDELEIHPYLGSFFLGLNLRSGPLGSGPELRRALALAIDRDKLTRLVLAAGELPAFSLVPPGMKGYRPQAMPLSGATQAEREERAKALYRSAGYSEDRPLRLQLRFNTSSTHRRMAVAVAAMWRQVLGVNTQMINEEWRVFVNNRRQGVVTQVFRGGWIADFPDPVSFLDLFASESAMNWSGFRSAGYDGSLEAARRVTDGPERIELLEETEARLWESQPLIPLYYYVSRHLVNPDVRGFVPNIQDIHLSQYMGLGGSPGTVPRNRPGE